MSVIREVKSDEVKKDRILGMILLSAYGDALGAPHELEGLRGKICNPEKNKRLKPVNEYDRKDDNGKDDFGTAFGIWPKLGSGPGLVKPEKVGVPTDDTSIQVRIVGEWICQLPVGVEPMEADFERWMRGELGFRQ